MPPMKVVAVAYFTDGATQDSSEWSLTTTVHRNREDAAEKVLEWCEANGLEEEDIEEQGIDAQLEQFMTSRTQSDCHIMWYAQGINHFVVLEAMHID